MSRRESGRFADDTPTLGLQRARRFALVICEHGLLRAHLSSTTVRCWRRESFRTRATRRLLLSLPTPPFPLCEAYFPSSKLINIVISIYQNIRAVRGDRLKISSTERDGRTRKRRSFACARAMAAGDDNCRGEAGRREESGERVNSYTRAR